MSKNDKNQQEVLPHSSKLKRPKTKIASPIHDVSDFSGLHFTEMDGLTLHITISPTVYCKKHRKNHLKTGPNVSWAPDHI